MPSRFASPAAFGAIVPVLAGVLIAEVAFGMMTTLIPLDLTAHGVPDGIIGAVGSAYFVDGGMLKTL